MPKNPLEKTQKPSENINITNNKKIQIKCKYTSLENPAELVFLQGSLKSATKENMRKLKNSLIKNGFVFPIYIWKNDNKKFIVGGHHRVKAVQELIAQNYQIDGVPCIEINAKNINEAKKFVLLDSAQYAKINKTEFGDFALEADIDVNEILNEIVSKEIELADIFKNDFPIDYNQGKNAAAPKIHGTIIAFLLTQEQTDKLKTKFATFSLSEAIKNYIIEKLCSENTQANS